MVAQSVAEILGNHVRLTVEGIDRMYLNLYVPALQSAFGAVSFFRAHRGQPLASSALMNPMSRRFVAALDSFIARHAVPLVLFRKGQVIKTVPEDQFLDAVLKEVASLLPEREAKLVYPEGGIKEAAGIHRTRDEGFGAPVLKKSGTP